MMWWLLLRNSMWLILSLSEHVTTLELLGCNSARNFDIVQNQHSTVTCFGLAGDHGIFWSIIDTSNETRIAECKLCNPQCPPCLDTMEGYNVNRESNESTTLQFLNTSLVPDGSKIQCSRSNDNTITATCNLFVIPAYTIPECKKKANSIEEVMQTPIRCEGLQRLQTMYWTITYRNGTVSPIAQCDNCNKNSQICPNCTIADSALNDFSVTREDNSSTLVIQNDVGQKDGATLRCSKRDNVTHADCIISVHSLHFKQEQDNGLPVTAVAGGIAGFVFIVAVVIVLAVVVKRRRSTREATKERLDTATLNDEFEEHINEFYQSAEDTDLPRPSQQNSPKPHSPAPLVLANPTFDAEETGSDGPETHLYAQVKEGKKDNPDVSKEKPGKPQYVKQDNKEGKVQKHANMGGAVYTECVSDCKKNNSATNVYMNVEESPTLPTDQDIQAAKHDSGNVDFQGSDPNTYINTATVLTKGNYTNVQSELNIAERMTKTAETADEYRHLQFSTPEPLEENPAYDHLTEL